MKKKLKTITRYSLIMLLVTVMVLTTAFSYGNVVKADNVEGGGRQYFSNLD